MEVALLGYRGKVGQVLAPALAAAGHRVRPLGRGEPLDLEGIQAVVDFTQPEAVEANVRAALAEGVPCVVGTTGFELASVDAAARKAGVPCFHAPNFAIGAVLMMRFAEQSARYLPSAEIVELHHETKLDAPSGTAKATASRLAEGTPIHSVRLPGLVAHQEVLLGGEGQLLTIRHDTFSRVAFTPGVLLALERVRTLPAGLSVGLEILLEEESEPPPPRPRNRAST